MEKEIDMVKIYEHIVSSYRARKIRRRNRSLAGDIALFMFFHPGNFHVGHAAPGGVSGVFQAVANAGIVFAFLGFRQAIDFAGEAKNPKRDVPLAIILAVCAGLIVYILLQIAFLGAVPADHLLHGWATLQFDSPFANLAAAVGLSWLTGLILFDAVISPADPLDAGSF